jgi:hypothetical protein
VRHRPALVAQLLLLLLHLQGRAWVLLLVLLLGDSLQGAAAVC